MQGIEFTDRYGGNPPSWLRACLACEAMGCTPQAREDFATTDEWLDAPFVTCAHCAGTARVPWWRSALRLPRWLFRGLRFLWHTNVTSPEMHPRHWTRLDRLRMTLWATYGADLGVRMPAVTPWPD